MSCSRYGGGVLPAVDRVAGDAHREDGVVVAVRVEAVADEQHVVEGDAGLLGELTHAVGLVDALLGDVDRRRAAGANLEIGDAVPATAARSAFFFSPVGSQAIFAATGAC